MCYNLTEDKMNSKIEEIISSFDDFHKEKANTLIQIITEMGLRDEVKLEGVLYASLRLNINTLDSIKNNYDNEIYNAVYTLEKIYNINYSQQESEAENLRKMFFAITKDIRTIMLKIALIVVELRFSSHLSADGQKYLANSIFALFAPLCARLGLSNYKTELENGAFRILDPKKYDEIQKEVDDRFHKRQPIVDRLTELVKKCMDELGIKGRVYGRKKHIYSIYKKLVSHSLDHIYDLIAVRAIVGTVADCFALIGKLHGEVVPMPNRYKDYISKPKPNGYQSIHSTVIFEGFPVEIQIRTEEMNQYAEYGIAAHWVYKEKRSTRDSLDIRLAWLRKMMEDADNNIDDLAESLNQDIYNSEIFVQTPKGKVIYLPNGSTPIDFAYMIHSEIGNKCVGAKVNGKMVPTTSTLNNGDVVEIITNPNSKGPSRDWLKICKTSEARSKINAFFKKNMKEDNIRLGKSMLESAIKEKGYSTSKLISDNMFDDILSYYNMSEMDELYATIGTNAISAKLIANKLAQAYQKKIKLESEPLVANSSISLIEPTDNQVAVKGLNNILIKFAGCCRPMYGDDIVGFVSAGRGIIIHRKICPNVSYFSKSRLIEANWKPIDNVNKKINKKAKTNKTNSN